MKPDSKPAPKPTSATESVLAAASVGFSPSDHDHLAKSEAAQAMTKEAWHECRDPLAMLCFLRGRASGRKFRLFATACARDAFASGTIPESECPPNAFSEYLAAILAAESFADGGPAPSHNTLFPCVAQPTRAEMTDEDIALVALGYDADVGLGTTPIEENMPRIVSRYRIHPTHYLRDIFGSVFHAMPLDAAFCTARVRAIAEIAYQERAMPTGHLHTDHLAILADALDEAGCTDTDLLAHLRSLIPHVRGCYALDLIMDKL